MINSRKADFWLPPSQTTASREIPRRHAFAVTGSVIDDGTHREIVFESNLERDFACIAIADRRVAHVQDQPPQVLYQDPTNGEWRGHTFDYRLTFVDGRKVAVAIKPAALVERSRSALILEAIRNKPPRGFADSFVLRTDEHISRDQAADARMIIRARRTRDDAVVGCCLSFVKSMRGAMRIEAVCSALGNEAGLFTGIVNLLDEGVLGRVPGGRIDDRTLVHRIEVGL